MSPREGYVTTPDRVRLYFEREGDGPRVVLVPNGFHFFDDLRPIARGRTLVCFDLRNRGRSEAIADRSRAARGIEHDVEDLEALRQSFGAEIDVIGHSYVGTSVIRYAARFPAHLGRVISIGPMPPYHAKFYPTHLTNSDATLRDVGAQLAALEPQRSSLDPEEFCRRFWDVLRVIYVADPADADKVRWGRCDLPNERGFMKHWNENILPSIQAWRPTREQLAAATAPVLLVHGRKDRSSPYGGGRDWASLLPNARLLTIENAAHAPWIEARASVLDAIDTFLSGGWPEAAEKVERAE